jgi:hypothetical protein
MQPRKTNYREKHRKLGLRTGSSNIFVTLPNEYSLYDSVTHVDWVPGWGYPQSSIVFFLWLASFLAYHKNPASVANGSCPKHVYCSVLVLILLFWSQDQNWRQRIWDKARCYWEHVGNPVGTWWDHIGKIVPPVLLKKRKTEPLDACGLTSLLPRISMPTSSVLYHFWPRLMGGAWTLGCTRF